MRNRKIISFLLYSLGVLLTILGLLILSGYVDNEYVANQELEKKEKVVFTEQRRGYVIEIRSSEAPEPSATDGTTLSSDSGIVENDRDEILLIDGEAVPYIRTSEGYRIYYQPPETDLPSAARSYVDTQPEKAQ